MTDAADPEVWTGWKLTGAIVYLVVVLGLLYLSTRKGKS